MGRESGDITREPGEELVVTVRCLTGRVFRPAVFRLDGIKGNHGLMDLPHRIEVQFGDVPLAAELAKQLGQSHRIQDLVFPQPGAPGHV